MENYKPESYGDAIADVYDLAIPHDEDTDRAISFLTPMGKSGNVLELGGGTGRLAIPIAKTGLDVSVMEISSKMIEQMRRKPGGDLVDAIQGDMANIPEGEYSLIYLVTGSFSSLTTQDSQVRCLQSVRSHLAPGGRFVMESYVTDIEDMAAGSSVWPSISCLMYMATGKRRHSIQIHAGKSLSIQLKMLNT